MMILTVVVAVISLIAGYGIYWFNLSRNKELMKLINTIKKRGLYVFLETNTTTFGRRIIKTHQNLAITDQKEFIIIPTGTIKSCPSLGLSLGHGDLYKSILVPSELPQFVAELKSKHNMTDHEIGLFFEETQNINRDTLKKICFGEIDGTQFDQKKIDLFKTIDSNISGFIHTGINRVSIAQNVEHLIKRENIMKLGKNDWVTMAIAGFIILLGLAFALKFAAPSILPYLSSATDAVNPIK